MAHRPEPAAPVERGGSLVRRGAARAEHRAEGSELGRAALDDVEELVAHLVRAELRMQGDPAPEDRVVDRRVLELRERGEPPVGELCQPLL